MESLAYLSKDVFHIRRAFFKKTVAESAAMQDNAQVSRIFVVFSHVFVDFRLALYNFHFLASYSIPIGIDHSPFMGGSMSTS